MDQRDEPWLRPIQHTCTFEERRFGTCNCRRTNPPPENPPVRVGHPRQQAADLAWLREVRENHAAQFKVELKRRLISVPSGQRIRLLRTVLGWKQAKAALELGISRRTLIRHGQGQHRLPWMRSPLRLRLCQLESEHEQELIGCLLSVEP